MEALPLELKRLIFQTDDPNELLKYCLINKEFNEVCNSDIFCKRLSNI